MSLMTKIDKQIRMDKVINSDVKLTNIGKKYSTLSTKELEDFLKLDNLITNDSLSLNALIGIAINPNLTNDLILRMYKLLHSLSKKDNSSKIQKATKTKNEGLRGKIRKLLSQHENLDDVMIEKLILSKTKNSYHVLGNPNIKEKHLQFYFDNIVFSPSDKNYSFLEFRKLIGAKNITQKLMKKWYNDVFFAIADWTYSDAHWYSIIESYFIFGDLWEEILLDIAGAPISSKPFSDIFRNEAVEHTNATEKVAFKAYEITNDVKYIPKQAKDIFLF